MTTTIQVRGIDQDLWRRAKAKAMIERLSTRQLLERLLNDWLKDVPTEPR